MEMLQQSRRNHDMLILLYLLELGYSSQIFLEYIDLLNIRKRGKGGGQVGVGFGVYRHYTHWPTWRGRRQNFKCTDNVDRPLSLMRTSEPTCRESRYAMEDVRVTCPLSWGC